MACQYARDKDSRGSNCTIGVFPGHISFGTCARCEKCTDREYYQVRVIKKTGVSWRPPAPGTVIKDLPAPPPVSAIGDNIEKIITSYGIKKSSTCNCSGIKNLLNSLTRAQVLSDVRRYGLLLSGNLKQNPELLKDAPLWIRLGIAAVWAGGLQGEAAVQHMAERMLRQACEMEADP